MRMKRICELTKGDHFIYFGIECIVKKVTEFSITYIHANWENNYTMSARCQAKVEVL